MNESPTFVLLCTMDGKGRIFLIGECSDEIEAVRLYSNHIAEHGDDHKPFVFMLPLAKWNTIDRSVESVPVVDGELYYLKEQLDPADNLFRGVSATTP